MTLREFVEKVWKPNLERRGVKPSTLASYRSVLEHHVFPYLAGHDVDAITPTDIEVALNALTKYSLKYQRNVALLLRAIFNHAVDRNALDKSPVRGFHLPKVSTREKEAWSEAEVKQILDHTPEEFKPLLTVFALTGMRSGEVLGLQWRHIDLQKGWIHIEQSLWNGRVFLPKNDTSMRVIPMGPELYKIVQELAKKPHKPGDFIFTNERGKPYSPDYLRRDVLYPILYRLGFYWRKREGGFHRFRHTAGSIVVANTGNLRLAQKLLGHSSIATTANIYTHVRPEEQRKAVEILEKAVLATAAV